MATSSRDSSLVFAECVLLLQFLVIKHVSVHELSLNKISCGLSKTYLLMLVFHRVSLLHLIFCVYVVCNLNINLSY
jgi:hypothetical protein